MTINGSWMIDSFNDSDVLWRHRPIPVDVKGRQRHNCDGGIAHGIYARSRCTKESSGRWKLVSSSAPRRRSARWRGPHVGARPEKRGILDRFPGAFDRPRPQSRRLHPGGPGGPALSQTRPQGLP